MNRMARNMLTRHIIEAIKVLIEEYEKTTPSHPREFECVQAIGYAGQQLLEINSIAIDAKPEGQ